MGTNTGARIRQARTGAKLTQAALGEAIGLSAAEISKAERGELQLSQAKLKAIAKATGVTHASLLIFASSRSVYNTSLQELASGMM